MSTPWVLIGAASAKTNGYLHGWPYAYPCCVPAFYGPRRGNFLSLREVRAYWAAEVYLVIGAVDGELHGLDRFGSVEIIFKYYHCH